MTKDSRALNKEIYDLCQKVTTTAVPPRSHDKIWALGNPSRLMKLGCFNSPIRLHLHIYVLSVPCLLILCHFNRPLGAPYCWWIVPSLAFCAFCPFVQRWQKQAFCTMLLGQNFLTHRGSEAAFGLFTCLLLLLEVHQEALPQPRVLQEAEIRSKQGNKKQPWSHGVPGSPILAEPTNVVQRDFLLLAFCKGAL